MDCSLNVLFVDDNEQLLHSLARLLAARGLPWDARFAQSGSKALASLDQHPCDVVVSDANLPDMAGSELLDRIKDGWPLTLRILLTARTEDSVVSGLLKSAHQLLSTPCPALQLLDAVQTACRLGGLYMNEAVRTVVHKLDHLPVVPKIYTELRTELAKEDFTVQAVGNIIAQDMGLTAGILKIVNSPYFGLSRRVDSPHQAVTILGANMLKGLVLYEQIFKTLDPNKYPDFNVERLWSHSLDAARCCRALAKSEGKKGREAEDAFLAGLLHDMGKIVLNEGASSEYIHVLRKSQAENLPLVEAEIALLGTTHAEIGAYVLGLWGFDFPVVQPIAAHHEPSRYGEKDLITAILHCTDVFLHDIYHQKSGHSALTLDEHYMVAGGLSERMSDWQEIIVAELQGVDA